jgi:hypothetical protein
MRKRMLGGGRSGPALATVLIVASSACAGAVPAAAADWADQREWSVVPPPESNQPGVQRDGTLRLVRFRLDGRSPVEDQETVVGWFYAAANGTLVERREAPPEEALLEIVVEKAQPEN